MACAWSCRRGFGRWWRQATATGCRSKRCNKVFAEHVHTYFHMQNPPRSRRVRKQHSSKHSSTRHNRIQHRTPHKAHFTQHSTAQHATAQRSTIHATRITNHNTAQHDTAWQHNTTQTTNSITKHNTHRKPHNTIVGVPVGLRGGSTGVPLGLLKASAYLSMAPPCFHERSAHVSKACVRWGSTGFRGGSAGVPLGIPRGSACV